MQTVDGLTELIKSLTPEDIKHIENTVAVDREERISAFLEAYRCVNHDEYQARYVDIFELINEWPPAARVAADEALYAVIAGDRISASSSEILMATLSSAREMSQ
jgi:nitrate reductase assembly molybdenum cofactor insertion protein NarJ